MRTLLITGATGFLGWNIARLAHHSWNVAGTYFRTRKQIVQQYFGPIEMGRIDLTEFREMREMLSLVKPDAVIHTAALSQPNYCEVHPGESLQVNVNVTRNLAGLCADREIPFIFTSTDLVFDGTKAPYSEDDRVTPVNIYGEHKALAEMETLERYPLAAVCRLPLMFGWAPAPINNNFLQRMLEQIRQGHQLDLFEDEYRTPVSAEVAARGLLMVAESGLPEQEDSEIEPITGLLHLGGKDRVSRYGFGQLVANVLDSETVRLNPVSAGSVDMPARRPADVTLDSSKAYGLGYQVPTLQAQLEQLLSQSVSQAESTPQQESES